MLIHWKLEARTLQRNYQWLRLRLIAGIWLIASAFAQSRQHFGRCYIHCDTLVASAFGQCFPEGAGESVCHDLVPVGDLPGRLVRCRTGNPPRVATLSVRGPAHD